MQGISDRHMPTMREQVAGLLRNNPDVDYWEKLVLRYAEALLAAVEEQLRGVPVEESGIGTMLADDYLNLPQGVELIDGVPLPKRWRLHQEGRHRLGVSTIGEEMRLGTEEMARRREALRNKPFAPSQVPFPSGPPED